MGDERIPAPVALRRSETEADAAFRVRLSRETRGGLFAGLDGPLADQLLRQQHAAQEAGYRARYPDARFDIVACDGAPAGRIVTAWTDTALVLVDIALLPECRGRGLGTDLIAGLVEEARAAGRPLRLSVASGNAAAQRLYRRLGFVYAPDSDGVSVRMEWRPLSRALDTVPDALRLPLAFDAEAMAAECAGLARGDWTGHFVPSNYDGRWEVIPLRAPAGATHPIAMIAPDPEDRCVDTPFLAACPAIRAALAALPAALDAVRLMRLGPGSRIKEHRDHALSFEEGTVRLHVPVLTHPGVVFRLNGRRLAMAAGSCWYLRLSDPHAVENPGPGDRVHLVIDARVGPGLAALFARAVGEAVADGVAAGPVGEPA